MNTKIKNELKINNSRSGSFVEIDREKKTKCQPNSFDFSTLTSGNTNIKSRRDSSCSFTNETSTHYYNNHFR